MQHLMMTEHPIGKATPTRRQAAAHAVAPVKTQPARIQGEVAYRGGDGPNITIRPGPVGVQLTPIDATLSWADGETRGSAAMPIGDFRNYVAQGAIKLMA